MQQFLVLFLSLWTVCNAIRTNDETIEALAQVDQTGKEDGGDPDDYDDYLSNEWLSNSAQDLMASLEDSDEEDGGDPASLEVPDEEDGGDPADYYSNEWLSKRCRQMTRRSATYKILKRTVAAPIAIVAGAYQVMDIWNAQGVPASQLQGFEKALGMATAAAKSALVGGVVANGVMRVTGASFRQIARLFSDMRTPICCCKPDTDECSLRGTPRKVLPWLRQGECPNGGIHEPRKCQVPELLTFETTTVQGCSCQNVEDCGTGRYFRGHAWCWTAKGDKCGSRSWMRLGKHWDYCSYGGPIGSFEPFTTHVGRETSHVFRDEKQFMALATPPRVEGVEDKVKPECIMGENVETLESCADRCLDAPVNTLLATALKGSNSTSYPCKGFAWNRRERACVALPDFAMESAFRPYLRWVNGTGWQTFKLAEVPDDEEIAEVALCPDDMTDCGGKCIPKGRGRCCEASDCSRGLNALFFWRSHVCTDYACVTKGKCSTDADCTRKSTSCVGTRENKTCSKVGMDCQYVSSSLGHQCRGIDSHRRRGTWT